MDTDFFTPPPTSAPTSSGSGVNFFAPAPTTGPVTSTAPAPVNTGKNIFSDIGSALSNLEGKIGSFITPLTKTPTLNQPTPVAIKSNTNFFAPVTNNSPTIQDAVATVGNTIKSAGSDLSNLWENVKNEFTAPIPLTNGKINAQSLPGFSQLIPKENQPMYGGQPSISGGTLLSQPANNFQDFLSSLNLPTQIVKNPVTDTIGNAFDDTVSKVGNAISSVTSQTALPSQKFGDSIEATASIGKLLLSPISTAFAVAEGNKITKPLVNVATYPFKLIGQGITLATTKIINALPISQEAKDNLSAPISDALSLVGEIYAGDIAGDVGVPILKDKIDAIKTTLNQNLVMNAIAHTDNPDDVAEILRKGNVSEDKINDLKGPLSKATSVAEVKDVLTGNIKEGPKNATTEETQQLPGAQGNLPAPEELQNIAEQIKSAPKPEIPLPSIKNPDLTPQSKTIIPTQAFRTLDMGNLEGTKENSETKALNKERIAAETVPMGNNGTGETFNQFEDRVLPQFQKILDTAKDGATVVTHSSVLKLMKQWQDEGRPVNFRINADDYNKLETKTGDVVPFKGKNGTIYVVRHGQTEDNVESNFRSADTKLTENGIQQAKEAALELKNNLNGKTPPAIYTSDLPRTIHTSNILMKGGEGIEPKTPSKSQLDATTKLTAIATDMQTGNLTREQADKEIKKVLDVAEKERNNEGNEERTNNIQQRSAGNEHRSGNARGSVLPISGRDRLDAERRLAASTTTGTDAAEVVRTEGKRLLDGEQIEITNNTHNVFRALGYSDEFSDTFKALFEQGGLKKLSFNPLIDDGNGQKIEVYAAFQQANDLGERTDLLQINNAEKDNELFTSGNILRHEIAGHSWYSRLTREDKISLFDAVSGDKQVVIDAWEKSTGQYQPYWEMTVTHMTDLIKSTGVEHFTAIEILKDAGVESRDMSLEEFINATLDLGKNFDAVNKDLEQLGYKTLRSGPQNTIAFDEHISRIAEQAKEISSSNPIVQKYIDRVKDNTLSFKLPEESRTLTPSTMAAIKSTPEDLQSLLKSSEDKARENRQQDRLTELDKIVAQSPSHDSYVTNLHNNEKLGELLPQLNKDVQDNGYSSLTEYYVNNKITSNVDKGIVPQRRFATPKSTPKEPIVEKREAEINPKEKLEAYKYIKDEMRDRINQHPGKVLQKYISLKEGDFQDFKNPDLAKTPNERKEIEARNNKVVRAAEIAMDADPRLSGMHDNPDIIREQIDEYKALKEQLRNIIDEEKQLKTDLAQKKEAIRLKEITAIKEKAKEFKFTVPELDESRSVDMLDIISQTELLKNHPANPFLRYVNSRNGLLPEIQKDTPGVYGHKMQMLLEKNGLDTVKDAQKLIDNYRAHSELLTEMYNERFDPIELAQANSVHKTPFSEMEKERIANVDSEGKTIETIQNQEAMVKVGNDVKKKVGAHDYLRTPDRVLTKIGLGDEAKLIAKQYDRYLKELPKNIDKISQWAKRVPGKDSSRKIFDYLDGKLVDEHGFLNPDVLTKEELAVGNEIKSWLDDWAFRLGLRPHEQISNYITHIFETDLIAKEFDVDFAKIIQNKVAGQVYDPFLEQRLGKMGYVRDAWRALDAYVKRATRKVNMDVALAQVKIAAEPLDIASFNYVKSYVDRINLRPTATDTLIDNSIKQLVGYRFGERPLSRITQTARKWAFRGTLGLNISSALRNLVQGANTYAMLGEKYTVIGYTKLLSKENQAELVQENVMTGAGQIQDRTLSSTKKFWNTVDKGIFSLFQAAENINRGSAYFGAKAKYYAENSREVKTEVDGKQQAVRIFNEGASEEQAIAESKAFAKKVQFSFGAVDTPVFLQSDLAKTLLQFQSFNTKQAEFLAGMMKDKNYRGLLRFALASVAFLITIGKLFGMKWEDLIPFYSAISGSYNPPPLIAAPLGLLKAALATNNQFGTPMTRQERITAAVGAVTPLIPFGTQAKKTVSGVQAIQNGNTQTVSEKAKALFFGSTVLANSATTKKLQKSLKTNQTKVSNLDPSEVATVQPIFDQAKAVGFGTPEANALVQNLTDSQYKVYKALKVQDSYQNAIDLQGKVIPIVQEANQLGFGTDAANKLVNDSFPDTPEGNAEYDAYTKVKAALYGTAATPTAAASSSADTGSSAQDNTSMPNTPGPGTSTWDKQNLIDHIVNISKAVGTDPVTTFKDIFGGDYKITGLTNGQVIVNRNSAKEAIEKKALGGGTDMTLDHLISLEDGGTNQTTNMWLIPKAQAVIDDQVENYLADALNSGKITGKQAQTYEIQYKKGADAAFIDARTKGIFDKVGNPMTFDQVKQAVSGN